MILFVFIFALSKGSDCCSHSAWHLHFVFSSLHSMAATTCSALWERNVHLGYHVTSIYPGSWLPPFAPFNPIYSVLGAEFACF